MYKQILKIEQKVVKNPSSRREADQLAIYKERRRWILDHQTQIRLIAERRIQIRDLRITNPAS